MRQTQILTGKFTSGEGAKGNFTGYNAKGERIFINKQAMQAIGLDDDKKIATALPIFAIIDTKEFETRDDDDKPTGVMFKRLQALSVFKTAEAMTSAVNADDKFEIDAQSELKDYASTKGIKLTPAMVESFANASI